MTQTTGRCDNITLTEAKIWYEAIRAKNLPCRQNNNWQRERMMVGKYIVNGCGVHANTPGETYQDIVEALHAYDRMVASTGTGILELVTAPYQRATIKHEPYKA